jgi:hypothetical protein
MLGIWVGVRQGDGGEKVSFLPISGLNGAKKEVYGVRWMVGFR